MPLHQTQLMFQLMVVVVLSHVAASNADAQWGSVTGRVVVTGDVPEAPLLHAKGDSQVKEPICRAHDIADDSLLVDSETKGLANVFVFLQRAPDQIHPDLRSDELEDLVFDQKLCRFEPHAMVVRTNQTVLVKSDDPVLHNTHTFPVFNRAENMAIPADERTGIPMTFRIKEPSPVAVKCDIHPWMRAWWLVVDHPYAAVTDERGEFTIDNLPAGEHEFRVWHERAEWIDKSLTVTVTDGTTKEIEPIEVPAEAVQRN